MSEGVSHPILEGPGASALLFQVVHQSADLWLKLACSEMGEANARLGAHRHPRDARPRQRVRPAGFRHARGLSHALGAAFDATLERRGVSVIDTCRRGRELDDLYRLAEALIEWDEGLRLWRVNHVALVRKQACPELWEARNELTRLAGLAA